MLPGKHWMKLKKEEQIIYNTYGVEVDIKKAFFGIVVWSVIAGLIAFLIALLLGISEYTIIFDDEKRKETLIIYVIYGAAILLMISFILFVLSKQITNGFWNTLSVVILVFFIVWFPVYRESTNLILLWTFPSITALFLGAIVVWRVFINRQIKKIDKKIEKEIFLTSKIFGIYWKLFDAKNDDKTKINLVDGLTRKEDVKFYRIDYFIKEHDK